MQVDNAMNGIEIEIPISEPSGDDARISVIVNKPFRYDLKLRALEDGMTVSDLTRYLWEEYVARRIRIKRAEGGPD